jgi:hypothetical protein
MFTTVGTSITGHRPHSSLLPHRPHMFTLMITTVGFSCHRPHKVYSVTGHTYLRNVYHSGEQQFTPLPATRQSAAFQATHVYTHVYYNTNSGQLHFKTTFFRPRLYHSGTAAYPHPPTLTIITHMFTAIT